MYKAPLKELRFAIHQLVGDQRLVGLSDLPDYSTDFADAVLDEAARFAEGVLDPINRIGDRTGAKWTAEGVRMPAEFKAAYAKFEDRRLQEMEDDGTGAHLRLNQRKEKLRKEFEKSPENPFNQLSVSYDASKDDISGLRAQDKAKIEARLGGKD